jgi:glycerol kinase
MARAYVLAIDQGTSSTRAILYDDRGSAIATARRRLRTATPKPGWAEQSPAAILASVVGAVRHVLASLPASGRVVAAGLAHQGETVVAWDRVSGRALAPAVTWQCRRSLPIVMDLAATHGELVEQRTGLRLDPYFSAGKMRWLLEQVPAVASAAERGRLALGTVDAWLTARLAGTATTEPGTASRTQLLDLATLDWSSELLRLFRVSRAQLPDIRDTDGPHAVLRHPSWPQSVRLTAIACDQQAALVGSAGMEPGALKATFGTGVFVVADTGSTPIRAAGLETSIAWRLSDGTTHHVLQGGVLSAAAMLDWMTRTLGLPGEPAQVGALAASVPDAGGVTILPSLAGIGAPWYRPDTRAAMVGLTAATTRAHLARAVLDAIAHRTVDVIEALEAVTGRRVLRLPVDGGLSTVRPLMQRQADLLGVPVAIAADPESTARGAARLAASGAGLDGRPFAPGPPGVIVEPKVDDRARQAERAAWLRFVERFA